MLLSEDSTFYGDLFAHVVRVGGRPSTSRTACTGPCAPPCTNAPRCTRGCSRSRGTRERLHDRGRGVGQQRARKRRQLIVLGVVVLGLFFAFWYAWSYYQADTSARAARPPAADLRAVRPQGRHPREHQGQRLQRLQPRRAWPASVARSLRDRGFVIGKVANDPSKPQGARRSPRSATAPRARRRPSCCAPRCPRAPPWSRTSARWPRSTSPSAPSTPPSPRCPPRRRCRCAPRRPAPDRPPVTAPVALGADAEARKARPVTLDPAWHGIRGVRRRRHRVHRPLAHQRRPSSSSRGRCRTCTRPGSASGGCAPRSRCSGRCCATCRARSSSPTGCAPWPCPSAPRATSTCCSPGRSSTTSTTSRSHRPRGRPRGGVRRGARHPALPRLGGCRALARRPRPPRAVARGRRPTGARPGRGRPWRSAGTGSSGHVDRLAAMPPQRPAPGAHRGQEAALRLRVLRLAVRRRRPARRHRRRVRSSPGRSPSPGTSSRCRPPSGWSTTTTPPTTCCARSARPPRRSTSTGWSTTPSRRCAPSRPLDPFWH